MIHQRNMELEGFETAEVALWRAVIVQAFVDAVMSISPQRQPGVAYDRAKLTAEMRRNAHDRVRAREWLLEGGADFIETCELALVDPDAVRESAVAIALKGWPADRRVVYHKRNSTRNNSGVEARV